MEEGSQYYSIDFRIIERKETAVPIDVNDNQEEAQWEIPFPQVEPILLGFFFLLFACEWGSDWAAALAELTFLQQ